VAPATFGGWGASRKDGPGPGAANAEMVLPKYVFAIQFPKCREETYIFGYDFISGTNFGRACRDIVNGGWVVDIIGPAHTDRAKRGPSKGPFYLHLKRARRIPLLPIPN
jgi:hypothetical protein